MKSDIFKTNGAVATISEPMGAETISKTGKCQTIRRNFLSFLVVAAIAVSAVFTSCDEKEDENGEEVYLATETKYVTDYGERTVKFEYDAQNRMTRINGHTKWESGDTWTWTESLIYSSAGDLNQYIDEDGDIVTFAKNGNIITVHASWWEDRERSSTLELNAQGFVVKWTFEGADGDDEWWKEILTFQYQGQNLNKVTYAREGENNGDYYSEGEEATLTYDDKKAPFYHCKTPQWFFIWNDYVLDYRYSVHNNVKTIKWGDKGIATFEYVYDDAGFSVSRDATERWTWYDEEDDEEYEEVWEWSETFKYEVPQTAGQKSALREFPNNINACNRNASKDNPSFLMQRFGSGKDAERAAKRRMQLAKP